MNTIAIVIIAIFALVFTILGLVSTRSRIHFALLGVMFCFITAAAITIIDNTYVFYDQVDNTVVTETVYYTGSAALSYVFYGLGMFNFAIAIILMLEFITGKELTEGEIGD